ncbi:hypothetical protein MIR68_007888 [Amoeboaphelidium protococcarum]|nr:hypothetical protein MIR68_007888 [Amoeboaphelidium protococcarum]
MHEEVHWIGDSNVESADSNATESEETADVQVSFVDKGCLSDPPEIQLYYQTAIDQNRLKTYRCIRGTIDLQGGIHQKFVGKLKTWNAGPAFADAALAIVVHRQIMRASVRNRPAFPDLGHYNHYLVGFVQQHTSQFLENRSIIGGNSSHICLSLRSILVLLIAFLNRNIKMSY